MNPGYQQQGMPPQGYQQQAPQQQMAPSGPAAGSALKRYPGLFLAGILLGIYVFCNWLIGAFKIDGDGARFLGHTGIATATAGLGILMLTAFHRMTEKDKEHPVGFGVALVVCVLVGLVMGLGALAHLK